MSKITNFLSSSSILLCVSVAPCAFAQQTTGTPGSPGATITIEGKQLPPEPPKFGGVIKEDAKEFQALLAAIRRATQRRAKRSADHD